MGPRVGVDSARNSGRRCKREWTSRRCALSPCGRGFALAWPAHLCISCVCAGSRVKFLPVTLAQLLRSRIGVRDAVLGVGVLFALYIPSLGQNKLPLGSLGDYLTKWRVNAPIYFGA